jgi:hypothetical protein
MVPDNGLGIMVELDANKLRPRVIPERRGWQIPANHAT